MTDRDWLILGDCSKGHNWVHEGGRPCPLTDDQSPCPARNLHCNADHGIMSQPVYRCSMCGTYDYGEPGGSGHRSCVEECMPRV